MLKKMLFVLGCLALLSMPVAGGTLPKGNLLKNGDFKKLGPDGEITGWVRPNKATVEQVDGKATLVLNGGYSSINQTVKLNPEWATVHLSMRMKATNLRAGDANWKNGRLAMTFKNDKGKRVGNWPAVFNAKGTTEWKQCERDYEVPFGAVSVDITPANFGIAGKLEFQDIQLTVTELRNTDPNAKPVIILKLDDVTRVTPQWQKCADFLKEENVKASFGIIGFALDKNNPKLFKWIKEKHDSGMVEFWNHGYKNRSSKDKGEFEVGSADQQRASLMKTQKLAKEKLGITLKAFGPHWSATTNNTVEALKGIPEIKSVFYYTAGPKRDWFVFKRYFDMEHPTFKPDFKYVKGKFEAWGHKKPYLCFQGHPNAWKSPERFEEFKKVVRYLKAQGCKFMTPTEYLESVNK